MRYSMEVKIHMTSGNSIQFDMESLTLLTSQEMTEHSVWVKTALEQGRIVVNLDNVEYITLAEKED